MDNIEVSGHHKQLLNFCKATGLKILNGQVGDDREMGNFTRHTPAGSSTVGYCLTRERNFDLVENFYIWEINTISDHAYLQLRLKINISDAIETNVLEDESQIKTEDHELFSLTESYNCKYIPVEDSNQKIKDCLNSEEIKRELISLRSRIEKDHISNEGVVTLLKNICINISDKSFKKVMFAGQGKNNKKRNFQERFDDDCRNAKKEVNKKRKSYQQALRDKLPRDTQNLCKEKYFRSLNEFNYLKRKRERSYWPIKKESLGKTKTKNPKEFWNKLKLKSKGLPFSFKKNEIHNYFKKLSGDDNENALEFEPGAEADSAGEPENDVNSQEILSISNRVITVEEVKKVIPKLKYGKAGGLDKIIPELIKAFDDNVIDIIALILNNVFDSGDFPEEWALGIIVILFKDGMKSELNNYRGITLLSMFEILLVGVINNRLWEVVDRFDILRENQAGSRHGYRTTDHIFTLTTVINHYAVKNKKTLFLCFVDFRKAFDKVNHKLLWEKIKIMVPEASFWI